MLEWVSQEAGSLPTTVYVCQILWPFRTDYHYYYYYYYSVVLHHWAHSSNEDRQSDLQTTSRDCGMCLCLQSSAPEPRLQDSQVTGITALFGQTRHIVLRVNSCSALIG